MISQVRNNSNNFVYDSLRFSDDVRDRVEYLARAIVGLLSQFALQPIIPLPCIFRPRGTKLLSLDRHSSANTEKTIKFFPLSILNLEKRCIECNYIQSYL